MEQFENVKVVKKIKAEQKQTLKILEDTKKLKAEENHKIRINRKLEEYKWNRFKGIIKNKQYFQVDDIDALKLPYDICIHLSAKGAGKTTEIMRIMREVINRGEKFMYGRVQKNELDREAEEFIGREESPVYPIKFRDNWYFFKKTDVFEFIETTAKQINAEGEIICQIPTLHKLNSAGYQYVGKGYSFLASNCLSGGKYEGYNTIIFDEILSYSPANRINKKVLDAWDASVHTIQRNKSTLKIYLFGNLQDSASHPILEHYGIDISDNLRYITRGTDEHPCNILYVNSEGRYLNTIGNKGGAAHHASAERQAFLKHNKVIKPTGNILTPHIFENMTHVMSFAVNVGGINNDVVYVELREAQDEEQKDTYFCITCAPLKITTLVNGDIFTESAAIYNRFLNTTPKHTIQGLFNNVHRLYKYRALYFDCFSSMELYNSALNFNKGLLYENQQLPDNLCL